MADTRRVFNVTAPEITEEMISTIPTVRDGKHFELFYNLIFSDVGFVLPPHLRPVAWALVDKSIENLMILFSPGSGKSYVCDIAFPLYEIGLDRNQTIMGVSSGADLMMDFLQTTMNIIQENAIYKLLFPNIVPDMGLGWSTTRGMFVKRSSTGQASPTYEGIGYGSRKITGKHAKILLVDDLHDDMNSVPTQIENVEDFFYRNILGRADPQGSRLVIVGRRWAENDLYGRLLKSGDWMVMVLPSIRETSELYFDVRIPPNVSCVFNNYAPSDRIEDIKVVYGENTENLGFFWPGMPAKYKEALLNKKNKPSIFETVYQSNPEASGSRIFDRNDFRDFMIPEHMPIGRTYDVVADYIEKMNFECIVQSWDTAFTANARSDASCCYTIGLRSCNQNHRSQEANPTNVPYHYDVYILDEFHKFMEYGDLKMEAVAYHNLWRPDYLIIENSAAGIPLIQSFQSDGIQVIGVNVAGVSKRSRALDGAKAGSAQGWAKQGNILIPRKTFEGGDVPWAESLINECHEFTGAKGKVDDRVDSLVLATNFAIDLGIQSRELPEGWRNKADIDAKLRDWINPRDPLQQLFDQHSTFRNPLYGLCASCRFFDKNKSFCSMHKRTVVSLGTCPLYESNKLDEFIELSKFVKQ